MLRHARTSKNDTDLKKPDINNYIVYDSIYIKSPEKAHV